MHLVDYHDFDSMSGIHFSHVNNFCNTLQGKLTLIINNKMILSTYLPDSPANNQTVGRSPSVGNPVLLASRTETVPKGDPPPTLASGEGSFSRYSPLFLLSFLDLFHYLIVFYVPIIGRCGYR